MIPDSSPVRARILQLWFARKTALDSGDTVTASARVEELRAFLHQEGIIADRLLGRGFAFEGYENLREGNYERAREAFDLARSFDPYLPEAQVGYALSLFRAGRGVTTSLDEAAVGFRLGWSQFVTDDMQVANATVLGTLALLCGLTVFSLVVIAKCQSRVRHDLVENLRHVVPERGARVLAWAIFLLPLLFWAGGIWIILFWLALSFRYMKLAERVVAATVFLLIGLSPVMVSAVLDRFEATTNPEVRTLISALQNGHAPETVLDLEKVVRLHPESEDLRMLLGNAYVRADRLAEGFDIFQAILAENPSHAPTLVDLGNVYFRLGEYAEAGIRYKHAAEIQPSLTASWWNLYLAQTELLHFAESDESLARARTLDGGLVGRLVARKKGEEAIGLLLEEQPSFLRLRQALVVQSGRAIEPAAALANPLSIASFVGLCFALLLCIGGTDRIAAACVECGHAHCPRCRFNAGDASLCRGCAHLFMKKSGISASVRAKGIAQLARNRTIASSFRRVLSLGLPGSGMILANRSVLGFPIMMCWIVSGALFFGRDALLTAPRVPVTDMPGASAIALAAVMILAWLGGNLLRDGQGMELGSDHGA